MVRNLIGLIVLLVLVSGISLHFLDKYGYINLHAFWYDLEHSFEQVTPENKDETLSNEYKLAITISRCNIEYMHNKFPLDKYENCVSQTLERPLEVYKVYLGITLTETWEELALSEKKIIVDEMQALEVKHEQGIQAQKANEAFERSKVEQQKKFETYWGCESDMRSKRDAYLAAQCPFNQSSSNVFENSECRLEATKSPGYKQYECKSPY